MATLEDIYSGGIDDEETHGHLSTARAASMISAEPLSNGAISVHYRRAD